MIYIYKTNKCVIRSLEERNTTTVNHAHDSWTGFYFFPPRQIVLYLVRNVY